MEHCPYRFQGAENGKELRTHSLTQMVFGEFQPSFRLSDDMINMRASSRSLALLFWLKVSSVESDLNFTCSTQGFSEAVEFFFGSFLLTGTSPVGGLG